MELKPNFLRPLLNPEHKGYKMNFYNSCERKVSEFNCDATQIDISNHYAESIITNSDTEAAVYVKYNSLQHS